MWLDNTRRNVFVVMVLTLLGVSALTMRSLDQFVEHSDKVSHTVTVVAQANQVMIDILEVQTGVRGYILTGKEKYLMPYLTVLKVVEDDLHQLRLLTQDNPAQQRRMDELEIVANQRLAHAREQINIRRTRGYQAAQQTVEFGEGKRLTDQIRAVVIDFVAEEERLLVERSRQARFSSYLAQGITLGLGVLAILILVLADARIRRDAVKQKQAEKERDRLFNLALDLYGIANFEGYFIQVNPAWEKTLGWSAAEILARPYIELVHPDDREQALNAVRSLVDGRALYLYENRYLTKDGSYRWLSWVAYPDAEEGLIFAIARDITEKKTQEEALRQASSQAQRADRAKSAFLATMSHELRTPLNAVIGFSEIMRDGLLGPLSDEQSRAIDSIFSSGSHLLSLINDVLDISKIEAGQIDLDIAPFDVRDAVNQTLKLVAPLAAKKGLELQVQVAPEPGRVIGDRRRVEQVLLNLLSNAIKFTELGEITLAVQPLSGSAFMRLSVCDSGVGIKAQDMSLLFQPFQQLDSTLARNYEGTGLGLAICRSLVQLMGGEVSVESEWGKGSTFSFTLPLEGKSE